MDQVLADILKTSGRTEQKVDDLAARLDTLLDDHDVRIKRLEKYGRRLTAAIMAVTVPVTAVVSFFRKST